MLTSADIWARLLDTVGFIAPVIILLLGFVQVLRLVDVWMLHKTLRKSIDAKSENTRALIERFNRPPEGRFGGMPGDDRNGLVLVAIGLAMAGFGICIGGEANIRIASGAALFPLFVGIALLVRRYLIKREIAKELGSVG